MESLKLKTPVLINGEMVDKIEYDLEDLKGKDIQDAVKEMQQSGMIVGVLELDANYHAAIFAKAAGLSLADIAVLKAKDYNKAIMVVRDFFLFDAEE